GDARPPLRRSRGDGRPRRVDRPRRPSRARVRLPGATAMSRPPSKLVLLAVLFAVAPLALPAHAAGAPTDLEAAARRAFEEERYAEAQALYERAARTGADPVAAWFDAGNCAFRRGAFAEAAVAYRRVLAAA